ncbi:MAG: hypothetical protein MJ185_10545 [Treponema sp.]|nr:hypothetical protein [Treponema sp.]
MKAIIISDEENVISKLDESLISNGFDTIIYRWLLKALDNIEEIRPDLVIVSANEYPRHWKTLTQFITSGIGGDKTKVFLLTLSSLGDDETEKARALGIKGFIPSVDEYGISILTDLLMETFPCLKKEEPVEKEPEAPKIVIDKTPYEFEDDEIPTVSALQENRPVIFDPNSASLIFVNPKTGKMITGSVESYENKTVHFNAENPEKTAMLVSGDVIETLTFELDGKVQNYTAEVMMNLDSLLLKLEEIHG